jgi:ribonucleoside-diphosphate reductase beta chain
MKKTLLFNPQGSNENQVFEGNTTGLCQLNKLNFPWASRLWEQMRSNFWQHQKIDLSQDKVDYANLSKAERVAYNRTLGFLVFLDSIQINNIPYIKTAITSPEISLCLAEQIAQEALHSASYQYIIESVLPSQERDSIYELWRDDPILDQRCQLIAGAYQDFINTPNIDNYLKALVSDYILEGLYFYCGFMFFYSLASRSLMSGTADIIKLIHRDELSHTRLYQELIKSAMAQYPENEIWDGQIEALFRAAGKNEQDWNNSICGDNILGITKASTQQYVQHLIETRLKAIGYRISEYSTSHNPYQHLERFSDLSKEAGTKTNFFEATVTSYQTSSTVSNWDF